MDLDDLFDLVLQRLLMYSDAGLRISILNVIRYNSEYLKCRIKKQISDTLSIFSSSQSNLETEHLVSSSKGVACQTSFIEERQVEKELRKVIDDLTAKLNRPSIFVTNACSPAMPCGLHPPPPPPPMPTFSCMDQNENVKKRINKNLSRTGTNSNLLSIGDIIKEAKNVTLKKIAKSPGGTPIRSPALMETGNDLKAILARRLRHRCDIITPCDSSSNNDSWSDHSFQ